jgi:hypothetical protein
VRANAARHRASFTAMRTLPKRWNVGDGYEAEAWMAVLMASPPPRSKLRSTH